MLSKETQEEGSESDNVASSLTKDGKRRKKAVSKVEGVPLYYSPELQDMMSSSSSQKVHHYRVYNEAVHFWQK